MKTKQGISYVPILIVIQFVFGAAWGQIAYGQVGTTKASNVADNWIFYCAEVLNSGWNGMYNPGILKIEYLVEKTDTLAYLFQIDSSGYVAVSRYREITPIISYSTSENMDLKGERGFAQVLRADLIKRNRLVENYLSGKIILGDDPNELPAIELNREKWDLWSIEPGIFKRRVRELLTFDIQDIGPLLESVWHQVEPYNDFCPLGDHGQRCVVGCVATATGQLMRYWQWPARGDGSHSYWWSGDGSAPGRYLYADFRDDYDWPNMLLDYSDGYNGDQADAVAELCYEVGVAYEMDYHVEGSGATTSDCIFILPTYFQYVDNIIQEFRSNHTADSWFAMLQRDLNAGWPLLYVIHQTAGSGHAMVCDGWRISGGYNQVHINYGWGGSYNNWYIIDNLYHSDPRNDQVLKGIRPVHHPQDIPTLSEWGMIILALSLLAIGTVAVVRRRKTILSKSI